MRVVLLIATVALVASGSALAARPGPGGDIPDNQVFVTFASRTAGWSIKYPEGWAQQGKGAHVTFRDKDNSVSVVVRHGSTPTLAAVRRATTTLRLVNGPASVRVSGAPAVKLSYATVGSPDPVTGKRLTLVVDRYYLWHGGRIAVIELATPRGVDNVDAYRLMAESFRWR
jgi:hypothetical protein